MLIDQRAQACRICGQPIDPCLNPLGAHLLCEPTAECRHELFCDDAEDDWCVPTSAHEGTG